MFYYRATTRTKSILLAGVLAGSILVSGAGAQSAAPAANPVATGSQYQTQRFSRRAELHYGLGWGEVIRFSYRVLDADKARILNDKKLEPSLIDPQAGVKLVIPELEKVGKLRQTGTTEEGKVYWMAFSNKGRHVKRGDRVNVVIGNFHADGLVVD